MEIKNSDQTPINQNEIDSEDISPASIPRNPHGTFFDFKFSNKNVKCNFSDDNCTLTQSSGIGWITILGDQSIDLNLPGKYYFEIKINNASPSWGISIGFADIKYDNTGTTILGYKDYGKAKSWAWFTYKSNLEGFLHDGVVVSKPLSFESGDVIKFVVETADKSISFYKNEEFIDKPFVDIDSIEIFPAFTICGETDSLTLVK